MEAAKIIQELLQYPDEWYLVPLHAGTEDFGCTCSKGKACKAIGKHPRMRSWAKTATNDEEQITELWAEKFPGANVGLLLGPRSGIIDVEFDDDEGKALAEKIFAKGVTPSYRSHRSIHRLFRWSPELPDVQKVIVGGLECRLGGGRKLTQSGIPPSRHYRDLRYEWLGGLSPHEVEVAELPEELLALLWNAEDSVSPQGKSQGARVGARIASGETISEGARDNSLLSYACQQAKMLGNVDKAAEQAQLYKTVFAMNNTFCKPPLEEADVKRIHQQAIKYTQQDSCRWASYVNHGLKFEDGKFYPGDWELTIVTADPPIYLLYVPAWKELTPDRKGIVTMDDEMFMNPRQMAQAVLKATHVVSLYRQGADWSGIWEGVRPTKGNEGYGGIRAQLLELSNRVEASPIQKRIVVMAEYLYDKVNCALEKPEPYDGSAPTRLPAGTIWLRWAKLWHAAWMSKLIEKNEQARLAARLGIAKSDFRMHLSPQGRRIRYCVLQKEHLGTLERLLEIDL